MDSFIALGAFLSLWGSLLASQTKASVCPSSQRPGWDPSSTPVAEGSASTSVLAVFERKTRTPLFTFKNSSGPTVFVCYAQFLFGAEAGVCEMHSRCLSSCPHSQCLLIRSDQVSHSHSCQIHFLLNQHQGFVWLWFIELLAPSWCSKASHLVQECFLYSDSLCSYLFELFPIGSVPCRCTSCCKRPHRYLIMWRFYFSQWRNHLQDKQFKHSWTVTAVSLSD